MLKKISICLLLLITVYTRFVNLNWDSGWGFHPDENNLWGASRSIKWFSNLDPKFYAYGGFPIYLYSLFDSKVQARAVSALLQTGIVGLLFLVGNKLIGWRVGLLAALMGIFSAGLIQAGHFLTVESLLGFFGLLILYSLISYHELANNYAGRHTFLRISFWLILASISLGFGVGTKVSFAVFAVPFFLILLRSNLWGPKVRPLQIIKELVKIVAFLIIAISIFLLTNPFWLDKWKSVRETLKYESDVAMGNLPVFYTRQFIGTIPGWFQAIQVFPYVTGWLFLPMFLIGAFVVCFKESPCRTARRLLMGSTIAALLSFIPFWAKWTRYVVQVLPVLILVAGIGADWVWKKGTVGKAIVMLTIISFLPQFFSTIKIYGSDDTRVAAAGWAAVNIPSKAKIFAEGMDLGIIPFNPVHGQNINLFNFYELDEDKTGKRQIGLNTLINESDYFISVSNRVYGNSLRLPDKFPASAEFYRRLFDGSLGFQRIAEFSSDRPSSFFFLPSSLFAEETFEVFDNPDVIIFQKRI